MAFDFGLKHIGVALGQTLTGTARGIATLTAKQGKPDWSMLNVLTEDYRPKTMIVGLPLNMDGSASEMSDRANRFAKQIERRYAVDVHLHDERLTSRAAKDELASARELGKAATDHELAACLILESWLSERSE